MTIFYLIVQELKQVRQGPVLPLIPSKEISPHTAENAVFTICPANIFILRLRPNDVTPRKRRPDRLDVENQKNK
jgi:hypothetical protein